MPIIALMLDRAFQSGHLFVREGQYGFQLMGKMAGISIVICQITHQEAQSAMKNRLKAVT